MIEVYKKNLWYVLLNTLPSGSSVAGLLIRSGFELVGYQHVYQYLKNCTFSTRNCVLQIKSSNTNTMLPTHPDSEPNVAPHDT